MVPGCEEASFCGVKEGGEREKGRVFLGLEENKIRGEEEFEGGEADPPIFPIF